MAFFTSNPFAINAHTYLNGDVNSDGKVKEDDVQNIVNHILGYPDPTDFSEYAADADHNGTINIEDIAHTIRNIFDQQEEQ